MQTGFILSASAAAIFAIVYLPVLGKLSKGLSSPYHKVDFAKRCLAAAIDAALCITCVLFFLRTGNAIFLPFGAAYVLLRDGMFKGQSVGKFIAGLVVINLETGQPCSYGRSAARNLMFLIPGANITAAVFETAALARDPKGHRLGDKIARTQVVEGLGARELVKLLQHGLLGALHSAGERDEVKVPLRKSA